MLLNESSRLGAFSKILLASSRWANSEEFCYVWNRLDTQFGLSALVLTPLGQSIEDSESSLWRTPGASDNERGHQNAFERMAAGHQVNLGEQAATPRLWPTPTTVEAQVSAQWWLERQKYWKEKGIVSGSLNPRFVCELMGYEVDHTNLKHWETLLSRSKHSRSSKR
jgi:hypothetical protein